MQGTHDPRVLAKGWAILKPDGRLYVDANPGATEEDTWRVALGYPTRGEVREAQAAGLRAVRVLVVECEESA